MREMISKMIFNKKVLAIVLVITATYITSTFLINVNSLKNGYTVPTTTTTTPTPLSLLLNKTIDSKNHVTIEKYDALKVHTKIMKNKIDRMTGVNSKLTHKKLNTSRLGVNKHVHMLYYGKMNIPILRRMPNFNYTSLERNTDHATLMENLKVARTTGAGVIIFPYPNSPIFPNTDKNTIVLRKLFDSAPKYNLSVTIAIYEYPDRTISTIRRDIMSFLEAYKNHPSLYKYKRKKYYKKMPVIYVMDTYTISPDEWKELLGYNGRFTIRNSPNDVIILGHLKDEEHNFHIRRSNFDGLFTCCNNNGESFGDTWKNWQSISVWSQSYNLLWSAGVHEGPAGVLSVKTSFNTLLRCNPRPSFVFVHNVRFGDDATGLMQSWMDIWSNSSVRNKFL